MRTAAAVSLSLLLSVSARARESEFQKELSTAIEQMLQNRPSSSFVIPVRGVGHRDLVDSFGDSRGGGARTHEGIDIFAPRGTPVVAATSGTIARISTTERGGLCLWIYSDSGYDFYYAHLDRWRPGLAAGDRVKAGEVVGYVGNSGNAANGRCHLHFEIRDGDSPLNPYSVLTNRERYGVGGSTASSSR
jgi:murein DD-endopeptidase MepM/ murein hydrolase activator NlpD